MAIPKSTATPPRTPAALKLWGLALLSLALFNLATMTACGGGAADVTTDPPPPPFTAAQIREATPAGRLIRFQMQIPGQPDTWRQMHFIEVSESTGTFTSGPVTADGDPVKPPTTATAAWSELRQHGQRPVGTTVTPVTLETALGTLACRLYETRTDDTVERMWFADDLPGPPVRIEAYAKGALISAMVMILNTPMP